MTGLIPLPLHQIIIDMNTTHTHTPGRLLAALGLLLLLLLAGTGCKHTEGLIFDRQAGDRVLDLIEEADETLLSSEYGWETTYKTTAGSYTYSFLIQMQFLPGRKVRMYTDYDSEPSTSTYTFQMSRGAVLSFDSYSLLHELSNPNRRTDLNGDLDSQIGTGYAGEQDFEITRVTPDTIFLRGFKSYNRVTKLARMTKAPDANLSYDRYKEASHALLDPDHYYKSIDLEGTPVGEFQIYGGSGDVTSAVYDTLRLYFSHMDLVADTVIETKHSVEVTGERALRLTPPISWDGTEYATFAQEAPGKPFVCTTDARMTINQYGNVPILKRPDVPFFVDEGYSTYYDNSPLSLRFRSEIVQAFRDKITPLNEGLEMKWKGMDETDPDETADWMVLDFWHQLGETRRYYNALNIRVHPLDGHRYRFEILGDYKDKEWSDLLYTPGTGLYEIAYYFTTLFDPDNYVYIEKLTTGAESPNDVMVISGLDSGYWFSLFKW